MNKKLWLIIFLFFLNFNPLNAEIIQDEVALELSQNTPLAKTHTSYNYESTEKIPVELKVIEPVKSESDLYEGQIIKFRVAKNVLYKGGVVLKRGTIVTAKTSVIITPGMNGIPASIILRDFEAENLSSGVLTNTYEIFGQDRSLLVFPLKWALTILPPTGSLTNLIMGGHANIKPKKRITIYYRPEWK